jgi:class 3 adenylate cyclase/tetratricopeptide (TPR) repeat protein
MDCPSCRAPARARAKFCESCGESLRQPCAECAAPLRAGARFCGECGAAAPGGEPAGAPRPERVPSAYTPQHLAAKILTRRSALIGERKQVTVLFVDVKGSQNLAESVDPEQWHSIMDRFFVVLAEGVHRFEGTINQFTGDGIMALFGAPLAHEEHAQRACYAALYLQEELRRFGDDLRRSRSLNFSVRMGLNSGDVVVGRIGDDLRMDYTAQGHTVGLAARMEQLAEPGRIYLTEHTRKLVAGFFELRDLGLFQIDEMREETPVYELRSIGTLRTRLDQSRARGFSRFVGRERELARLGAGLDGVAAGRGQVIGVRAEPGVGKSRLFYEFAEICRARGVPVRSAVCAPHGRHVAYLPILELLRAYIGLGETDDPELCRRKITGTLMRLDSEFEPSLPMLFEFLGVPDPDLPAPEMAAREYQAQLFAVLRRITQTRSVAEPAVLVIEDLHWIDAGSQQFLEHLASAVPDTRTLLLVNYRPEYDGRWLNQAGVSELELQPLGPAATDELLSNLVGDAAGSQQLLQMIRERAAGNPFFIEEVVRSLVEDGTLAGERGAYRLTASVNAVEVPATVQPVIASRVDRLAEFSKQVLQTAAVIGPRFNRDLLERILNAEPDALTAALDDLIGTGFIHEVSLYPVADYEFSHPLTHDVAYRAQLFDRRAGLHRAVAECVSEQAGDALDHRSALLAHHWEAAGEPVEAARWHDRAARWVALKNPQESLRHWQQVQLLLRSRVDSAELKTLMIEAGIAILNVGWRFGIAEAEAEAIFDEGRSLAAEIGDAGLTARVLMSYGQIRTWASSRDPDRSLELGKQAMQLADRTDDALLQSAARSQLARAFWRVRDYRAALAHTDAGRSRDPGSNEQVRFRGRILAEVGLLDDARRDLETALGMARSHEDVSELTLTHLCYAIYARFTGDFELQLRHAERALELADHTGDLFSRAHALHVLGESHLRHGRFAAAAAALRDSLATSRSRQMNLSSETGTLGLLAEAHLGLGQSELAARTAEEALDTEGTDAIQAMLSAARVRMSTTDVNSDSTSDLLDDAERFVELSGARSWEPQILVERAALAAARGNAELHGRLLHAAEKLFDSMGAAAFAAQIRRERGTEPG